MNYKLTSCVWEITLACCFSCKYCGSRAGLPKENELTTPECLDLSNQLCELGVKRVSMIGGEVFMRKDWALIVHSLTSRNVAVNIISNGFLFTQELIDKLKELNIESISISLDGPKKIHDKYRQIGSFDRAIKAIDVLCQNDIPVSVITTLNSENINTLCELSDILINYPIFAWQLQACSPMGNAANGGIDYSFNPMSAIEFVRSKMYSLPFAIGIADNIGYFTEDDDKLRGFKDGGYHFPGCRAGLSSIGIDSVGNIRGCESMYDERFNEGNIRNQSLKSIWENPDNFAYNRKFTPDRLTGQCARCELGKYCGGGCRSYNHFVKGNLYEAPVCAKNI